MISSYCDQAQIRKYGLPAAWPNEDDEDRQAALMMKSIIIVLASSPSPSSSSRFTITVKFHANLTRWYNDDYVLSAKIMMTMPVKMIYRQARHDLLEKYRPRILMTEAELAEDAVRMMG